MRKKPTGRTSVKGTTMLKGTFKRTAYKIDLKLAVLAYWNSSHDVECTLKKFWPNELDYESKRKMLYKWKKTKIEENPVLRESKMLKIRPDGIGLVLPPDVEMFLANWIRSLRSKGIPVSNEMIRIKAK